MSYQQRFQNDVMKLVELSKNDTSLITVEATVITGFENFAMEECQEKCKPINIGRAKGRIYFNIPVDNFSNVLKLRAVDNIFLVNEALGKIDLSKDKEKDLRLVQSLVDKVDWNRTLTTWAKLTEFGGILFPPIESSNNPITDFTNLVLDKENENCPKLNDSSTVNINAESSLVKETINADIVKNSSNKSQNTLSNPPSVHDVELSDGVMEPSQMDSELPKRKNSTSSDDSFYSMEEVECSTDNCVDLEKNKVIPEKSLTKNKADAVQYVMNKDAQSKVNPDKKNVDPNILKFRATCNRVGEHSFSSMEAAAVFGGTLQDKFNWTVNLDNFNLNVILNINSDKCYICSAVTPKSLHRRNITHFGYTTLRSTMCYNMIRLAQPTKGEILIDPLCGGGSISIEGALGFSNTFHICGDNNDKAIKRTAANINHITKNQQPLLVDPLKWSAKRLPLRDQCVDVFVTDLPFGKRSGKRSDNLNLYKNVLTEMARVIRCGTGRAVLLTNDKTSLTRALGGNNNIYWRQVNSFGVNQGGLYSTVFLLLRTSKAFLL
ncbi:tRNA (guanine(6)-N2)-methyltransferase THUMP3 [Halyomorpha halys]|uniref:tRNA (guanine(6)-N2)-methyltransferase THUMP3 n=1 Tax=Halyomorpha halys TaxID=286706 RepID=UPI0006D501E8|nr:THUMP domain-containing protein 3-like [Halyomorpha halys]